VSTAVDSPATRPAGSARALRRWWWLAPELVLVLAAVGVAAYAPDPTSPGELRAQVAARTVAAIERLSPAEHHDHGHEVDAAQTKIACVAEIMGFRPADAKRVEDVRTAYAYFLCAAGAPGQPYPQSAHISGATAVDLRNPPVVHIQQAGTRYDEWVRAVMPPEYRQWAVQGFHDPTIADGLVAKYQALVGTSVP
jgi:hypothetical protein